MCVCDLAIVLFYLIQLIKAVARLPQVIFSVTRKLNVSCFDTKMNEPISTSAIDHQTDPKSSRSSFLRAGDT